MAFGLDTIKGASGAVDSLFKGFADKASADLKAKGLNLDAEGLRVRARGSLAEASNYDLAGDLALKNEQFTATSTSIKLAQQDRVDFQTLGGIQADIAGAGFAASGSALDLMRDSAAQGALSKAVAGEQGLINEEGYKEQAKQFETLANAGRATAASEMDIANRTDQLADETRKAGDTQATGDYISGAFKAVTSIASIFI